MTELPREAWAAGFPELDGKLDRVVYAEGDIRFTVTDGAMEDGSPGLAILIQLPGERYALAGIHLLTHVDQMIGQLVELGWAETFQATIASRVPGHTSN